MPESRYYRVKITYTPTVNSPKATRLGDVIVKVAAPGRINLQWHLDDDAIKMFPDKMFDGLAPIVRQRIREFKPLYLFVWDENNGIETEIKEF